MRQLLTTELAEPLWSGMPLSVRGSHGPLGPGPLSTSSVSHTFLFRPPTDDDEVVAMSANKYHNKLTSENDDFTLFIIPLATMQWIH